MNAGVQDVLQFWFGKLDAAGMAEADRHSLWFTASAATDATCRSRFGRPVEQALSGELAAWADTDSGLVALVLLLDQLTRNIYRGTPDAFAGDAAALALARQALDSGRYRRLPAIHQVFVYLPLEHSEDLSNQEECVALFEQLASATGSARVADFGRYARAHRDVIARFGRFPHRNPVLGRVSTAAEEDYLATHGGF